jgi:hypothetical protein
MLMPGSRIYHLCNDVIPISAWEKAQARVLKCKSPPKPWYKPWYKPIEQCQMSTLSDLKAKELAAAEKKTKKQSKTEEKTTTTKE